MIYEFYSMFFLLSFLIQSILIILSSSDDEIFLMNFDTTMNFIIILLTYFEIEIRYSLAMKNEILF